MKVPYEKRATSLSVIGGVIVSASLVGSLVVRAASAGPPLEGARVRTFVAQQREDVRRACWTSDHADSEARVKLSLDVAPDGRVRSAGIADIDGDHAVGLCVRKVVKQWRFPTSGSGGRFFVPFVFTDGDF